MDINYYPNENSEFYIKFQLTDRKTTDVSGLFGVNIFEDSTQPKYQVYIRNDTKELAWSFGNDLYSFTNQYLSLYTTSEIELKKNQFRFNDNIINISGGSETSSYSMGLFGERTSELLFTRRLNLRVYRFTIKESGILVRDFIPCYNVETNVVGLYEIIERKFYSNISGSSQFEKSNKIDFTNIQLINTGNETKNLIPYPYHNSNTRVANGVSYLVDTSDYSISATGTAIEQTSYYYLFNSSELIISEDSVISVTGLDPNISLVYVANGDTSYIYYSSPSKTINAGSVITTIQLYVNAGKTVDVSGIKVQLEKGNVPTEYIPYGKYRIPIKISDPNIWDEEWELGSFDNTTGEKTNSSSVIRSKNFIPVEPNTQYHINQSGGYRLQYDENKNYIGTFNLNNTPTASNCHYIMFRLDPSYGKTYKNNIVLNKNNQTINIFLRQPLRKIDNYTDYIEYKTQKLVKNVGARSFSDISNKIYNTLYNFVEIPYNTSGLNIVTDNIPILSSQLPYKGECDDSQVRVMGASITRNLNVSGFRIYDPECESYEDYQTKYNNLLICYPLKSPNEESINLPQIECIKGTNILLVDTIIPPSRVNINYYKK